MNVNSVAQSFASTVGSKQFDPANREVKINENIKVEESKASKIAEQIERGEYKVDLKATAEAITDALI